MSTVTGHLKVTAKGPRGGDQTPVDRDVNQTFTNKGVTVTFNPPASSSACPTATASYTVQSIVCDNTVNVVELGVNQACAPLH